MTFQLEIFADGNRVGDRQEVEATHCMDAALAELNRYSRAYQLIKDLPMKQLKIEVQVLVELPVLEFANPNMEAKRAA